ncbi:MAG TPA: TolC family protein, partial [Rhodanobacteraceae bacterium]|nr:TolC family protein [Rhodanobacteraceae bacterium]
GYRAALIDARISTLQLRAAGLLPDPQLSASVDHPSTPGYSQAWNLGLSEDLSALLTRGATLDAARARLTATRLQLAWQGWALAQGAAATYVDLWTAERRSALLARQVQMARERNSAFAHALGNGDVTLESAAASLVTLSDAEAQLATARQAQVAAQAQLNALLGLAPAARYALGAPQTPPLPDRVALDAALQALPRTRPDLLALAAGYGAVDANFRAAVLAQFPGLSVGVSRASDTSRVQSSGLSISLNLPVFGGAQARARIAEATRERLHADYQARLDQADAEARALAAQLAEVARQRARLQQRLPQLRTLAARADTAFAAGNLAGSAWAAIQQSLLARELEALDLTATLAKGQVALAALLGRVPPGAAALPAAVSGDSR